MNILETFYILFKTDADKAADKLEDVDRAADKAADGLKETDKAAKNVGASFLKMAKDLAAPLVALASVGSVMSAAIGRADVIRQLDLLSTRLNDSVENVDALQRSVREMGGDPLAALDSVRNAMERFNEAAADPESTYAELFQQFGIAYKDAEGNVLGATEALQGLQNRFRSLRADQQLFLLQELSLDDDTLGQLLRDQNVSLAERIEVQKELGVVTDEHVQQTRMFFTELGRAYNMLTSIGNRLLSTFLPILTKGLSAFNWLMVTASRNWKVVEGMLIGVAGILTAVYGPAVASAAVATLVFLAPWLAIAAAIGAVIFAIGLLYEDIVAFMNGEPSLIGVLAEKYEWFGKVIEWIAEQVRLAIRDWKNFTADIALAVEWVDKLWQSFLQFDWTAWLSGFTEAASAIIDGIKNIARSAMDALASLFSWGEGEMTEMRSAAENDNYARQPDASTGPQYDSDGNRITGNASRLGFGQSKIEGFKPAETPLRGGNGVVPPVPAGIDTTATEDAIRAGNAMLNRAGASPLSVAAAGMGPVRNEQKIDVTVGEVNVEAKGADADEVARVVAGGLQKHIATAVSQLDDGVAA